MNLADNYFIPLSLKWLSIMEKRYLVYKSWNGQIHTSIEYGELTTGEGKTKRDPNELQRFQILHETNDLNILKELYPLNIKAKE